MGVATSACRMNCSYIYIILFNFMRDMDASTSLLRRDIIMAPKAKLLGNLPLAWCLIVVPDI